MQVSVTEVVRFLQAAHVSQWTEWPYQQRGAIVLNAYPEQLKTTILKNALKHYNQQECLSDLNAQQLENIRGELIKGNVRTLGFSDFQKVWERDERTSANTEGIIRALTEEGWEGLPSRGNRRGMPPARACCMLCVTPDFYESRYDAWRKNGMLRRTIMLSWRISDQEIAQIQNCICAGQLFRHAEDSYIPIPSENIPMLVTEEEGGWIRDFVNGSERGSGKLTKQVLLHRTFNTLKWFYRNFRPQQGDEEATRLFRAVLTLAGPHGGEVVLKREVVQLPSQSESSSKPVAVPARAKVRQA